MSHRIRLGPPWKSAASPEGTLHSRSFGRPRRLDPGESVWLIATAPSTAGVVSLNGQPLGQLLPGQNFEADVTSRLNARNEILVAGPRHCPLVEFVLEIRPVSGV